MSDHGARRVDGVSGGAPAGPRGSATGAKAAAIGLWVVVVAGLAYGVSQAVTTAGKLFG